MTLIFWFIKALWSILKPMCIHIVPGLRIQLQVIQPPHFPNEFTCLGLINLYICKMKSTKQNDKTA